MKATPVGPSPGRSSVTTAGELVTIAPVGKAHLSFSAPTFAAVMLVSAGLKKRRRGPPAYAGHSVARLPGGAASKATRTRPNT